MQGSAKGALGRDLVPDPLSTKAKWIHDLLAKAIMWALWNEKLKNI